MNYSLIKNVSTFLKYYENYSISHNIVRNKVITNFTKSDLFSYNKNIRTIEDSINILFFTNFKKVKNTNTTNSSQPGLKVNNIHRSFYFSKKKSFPMLRWQVNANTRQGLFNTVISYDNTIRSTHERQRHLPKSCLLLVKRRFTYLNYFDTPTCWYKQVKSVIKKRTLNKKKSLVQRQRGRACLKSMIMTLTNLIVPTRTPWYFMFSNNNRIKYKLRPFSNLKYPIKLNWFLLLSTQRSKNTNSKLFQISKARTKHKFLQSTTDWSKCIYIYTKHGSAFINYKNGVFFPKKFSIKNVFNKSSYKIKKVLYSFVRRNEYKKHIFNTRKKLIISKVSKFTKNTQTICKLFSLRSNNIINFLNKDMSLQRNFSKTLSVDNIYNISDNSFLNKSLSFRSELRMPRIRFKPGYQRLWRNFRIAFAELVNFRFLYQQQLTKYLTKFLRKVNQNYFSFNENSVSKVLIYSRLVPDELTFNLFYKNKLIFLNGKPLLNDKLYIYKNDFIQLEISSWYYIFSKWLISLTYKRNLRFKNLVFKKSLAGRYKVMKQVKQRSNYTPSWITTMRYDFADIKMFLEVDFFTLSVFYIYNHNFFSYYAPDDVRVVRYNIYRLYNWKYIN